MRKINQIGYIKYTDDWQIESNIIFRNFIYKGVYWSIILRHHGIGGYTIRLINSNQDELYICNFGINKMILTINHAFYDINDWYYEDLNELKVKIYNDLEDLLKMYEKFIEFL